MQETLAQIFSYVWGVWRHRWLVLGLAWLVTLGGWMFVWQMPEAYVASARVYVDTNSILRPLLRGLAIQPNINQRISMLSRTLLSRPNLEKLMRMTDLDLQVSSEAEKEKLLSELAGAIRLSAERGNASLYSISVQDESRDMAKRIAQSLISVFIESSLSQKREDSSGAQDFLDDQIADYEERLIAAENRLARFKQENVDVLAGSGGDYYSRLQRSKEDLSKATLQLREMENRRNELKRQLDGEDPIFISSSVAGTGMMSPLDSRIQSLRVNLDGLLSRYTEKHPEVRQIKGLIEELEGEKADEYSRVRENAASASGFTGLSNSPVYQGMRSMLAETEASVAELSVRVAEYERRLSELTQKVNNIPEIEAELKQLDRDYGVIASQNQELLERRESARLGQDVEQNASDVTFRVIDPPYVPLRPSEPNKPILNAVAIFVGLAAGVGAGLLVSLISPVISDSRTLAKVTGLPLLGGVTINRKPEEKRRALYELVVYLALSACLPIAYFGLVIGQGALSF
jgi:polysaccharide chain length determinant protein (PEP-CTERM system associated)